MYIPICELQCLWDQTFPLHPEHRVAENISKERQAWVLYQVILLLWLDIWLKQLRVLTVTIVKTYPI